MRLIMVSDVIVASLDGSHEVEQFVYVKTGLAHAAALHEQESQN